jgi:hypothetical protein
VSASNVRTTEVSAVRSGHARPTKAGTGPLFELRKRGQSPFSQTCAHGRLHRHVVAFTFAAGAADILTTLNWRFSVQPMSNFVASTSAALPAPPPSQTEFGSKVEPCSTDPIARKSPCYSAVTIRPARLDPARTLTHIALIVSAGKQHVPSAIADIW